MTKQAIQAVVKALGACSIAAGACGLVVCAPYIASANNWIIVIAAGVPFVAGAVLYVGGLLTVAYLIEK